MGRKKNLILLGILLLTLAINGGHFAYTWITDPASLSFPLQGIR